MSKDFENKIMNTITTDYWKLLFTFDLIIPLFIILKLTGALNWPWWLVLIPLWILLSLLLIRYAVLITLLLALKRKEKRRVQNVR